jgi:iron complex outermembrane receptor protein
VTSSPLATTALNAPQPTSVLSGSDLRTSGAPSLGETASVLPGVRSVSTGSGIGKPVIRGLTSNRVLVLADGQRLETQQWGDEHSPNVETADAERIEVIRGPASVLYGSDALGGVINVVDRELPDAIGKAPFVRARASAGYATNNEQPEGTLTLEGASGPIGFRVSGAARSSGDLTTPDGPLFNSAIRSVNGSGSVGMRGVWGSAHVTYVKRDERLEVHEDPAEDPAATPFQRIGEDRVHVELSLPAGESHFDIDAGYERNRRREFAEEGATDVELGLLSKTWTADVRFHHIPVGRFDGIVGVTGLRNTFDKFGEETLVPGSAADNVGVFASEQATFGPVVLSLGARYDYRHLDVDADPVLGIEAQARNYHAVSGSAGLVFRTSGTTAIVLNVGRGFRAPSTFELFSNGVHEGTARFERGNPDLDNETSLNTDLAFRVQSNRLSAEVGGFLNYVDNFIYPRPTGTTDPETGFGIFDYTQGNARLYGLESAVEYHPTTYLHIRGAADYVRGQNTDLGIPLAFIPPLRISYSVQLEGQPFGAFTSPYLSVAGETNAHQAESDPADFAPPGYTLAHLGAGIGLEVGERTLSLDVQVRNLFDKRYTAFLSRYKTWALDPGRNLIVRVSTGF